MRGSGSAANTGECAVSHTTTGAETAGYPVPCVAWTTGFTRHRPAAQPHRTAILHQRHVHKNTGAGQSMAGHQGRPHSITASKGGRGGGGVAREAALGLQGLPSMMTLPAPEHVIGTHSGHRSAFRFRHRMPSSSCRPWQSTLSAVLCSIRSTRHTAPGYTARGSAGGSVISPASAPDSGWIDRGTRTPLRQLRRLLLGSGALSGVACQHAGRPGSQRAGGSACARG